MLGGIGLSTASDGPDGFLRNPKAGVPVANVFGIECLSNVESGLWGSGTELGRVDCLRERGRFITFQNPPVSSSMEVMELSTGLMKRS